MMNQDDALVSVIIPVYNSREYLDRCVSSVLKQTYRKIEIIIVDDGSSDGSFEECRKYERSYKNIKVYRKNHTGPSGARIYGLKHSAGKIISFVDSDDWIEASTYEKMMNIMKKSNADVVCAGYFRTVGNDASIITDKWQEGLYCMNSKELYEEGILINNKTGEANISPSLWNKLFKKELLQKIMLRIDENIRYAEDIAIVYSLLPNVETLYVMREAFYHYCSNSNSITHRRNEHLLEDINKVYLFLDENFRGHKYENYLIKEKEKIIVDCLFKGINSTFFCNNSIIIPTYFLPELNINTTMRIGIYGAGKVGKCYYNQLNAKGFEHVFLIDKYLSKNDEEIVHPDCLKEKEIDIIIIGIREKEMAELIKTELVSTYKVEKEKILWKAPIPFLRLCMR